MSIVHLIMPMGGAGSRFFENGFVMPKPLIEINGKPFFYWATQSIVNFIDVKSLTFVVLKAHIDEFNIDKKILEFYPNAEIEIINEVLKGPVLTCLNGINKIADDLPIIINDCDHMFKCSCINLLFGKDMSETTIDFDGGLITFNSNEPFFSYINYNNDGKIIGTVEKKVVSNKAICGAYVFKNANIFKEMSEKYLKVCEYSEFFLSGVYNVMCQNGLEIRSFETDFHISFGTPKEYNIAKEFNEFDILE